MAVTPLYGAKIIGTGKADLPDSAIVDNYRLASDMLERANEAKRLLGVQELPPDVLEALQTSNDWIFPRTGISRRYHLGPEWTTSKIAASAAKNILADAGLAPDQIGDIRVSTVTPDHLASPPCVSETMAQTGIPVWTTEKVRYHPCLAGDVSYACSGFLVNVVDVISHLSFGLADYALSLGADKMTTISPPFDRMIWPILADHGGGFGWKRVPYAESDVRPEWIYAGGDWTKGARIITPWGGSAQPLTLDLMMQDPLLMNSNLQMQGRVVMSELVKALKNFVLPEALEKAGLKWSDIDIAFFHQANYRIIDPVVEALRALGLRSDAIVYNTIDHYGNTTNASVPIAVHDARRTGVLKPGMLVMIVVMGGGYSWVVMFLRWSLA
ncbi:MAG: hypothetical protein A2898_02705 [Candidatus Kerfeldbacteria bacterium RIFCSPLOWO2_01_FULL_48_11]|uniref:Beta-ketoacyl-[acyl-carrier-protein] synthase III C-terminal domain-containing protein n=1 Tax=Candidatus Kerfeldbacteria bacterium RIFCSPLOWO2_01_FULL_48_11 TaxID=1798543 RepID=A0A1G2B1X8_9BACT|nr:MAG: 3-oxoacyl-[acyl-carrier-protein] synthase 3 [Parcubacteria group bacterium GW2011_GWA2_48_9]KKW15772.1 MAG: 3-oxoacyl-[acyl-carrier-protein] synthase 3 [Parcubacteria group bacterium GW2011_GWC2_49_9]OGY83158.1 MAG: hypothetical protein A2898_02705 [Candidatus Kerfeldbacteria bacterium RIFCSPLOWO2_01_FULL_48_11]HCM68087.1 hypothetical protein [Candidatus Kerfeldbacteria bacterium]